MKRKTAVMTDVARDNVKVFERPAGARRLVPFKEALRYGSWGKDRTYQLIREGKILAVKDGRKTLVDLNTVDSYQASLPAL